MLPILLQLLLMLLSFSILMMLLEGPIFPVLLLLGVIHPVFYSHVQNFHLPCMKHLMLFTVSVSTWGKV